ncbi:winged helix-turn-helix domain-containing protein [Rhodococcus sp. 14-2470-1b]|uniref:winged helix-turn-helix domain-containing protein n=1 Tax=Rhodococcus sp. 14-2470-1b TaxID=2023149 RepID=UPI0020CCBAA3|nr:winged helix-turn-helix domain-containing protein [Rhodococcus sp. 14-2470-1b]
MTIHTEVARKPLGQAVLRPRQQVEETIRSAILSGDLESGEMLPPEAELARQFNVSRTTLREALRVLSSQHRVTFSCTAACDRPRHGRDLHQRATVRTPAVPMLR